MREDAELLTASTDCVDQRRMRELVEQESDLAIGRLRSPGERLDSGVVRLVPAGEKYCCLRTLPPRDGPLGGEVRGRVAGDQGGGGSADAVLLRAALHGCNNVAVLGEAEVIVGAEIDQPAAVDRNLRCGKVLRDAAMTIERKLFALCKC